MIAAKQSPKLQLLFSYTQVWPHLAGTWQPNDPAFFIQPNAFPFDRGLLSNDNRTASSNNGLDPSSAGQSSIEWMQQIGRANITYRAPYDILLSASYTYQNGRYLWTGLHQDRCARSAVRPPDGDAALTAASWPIR